MGGKGGGGGGGNWQDVYMTSPTTGGVMTRDGHAITKAEYAAKYYDIDHPAAPAPVQDTPIKPAAAPEPAPAPAAPAPEPTPSPLGPPIDAGGGVDQPGTGDQLGGAVVNPPKYWVGGIDSYKKKKDTSEGGTTGSLTTTQT